MLQWPGMRAEGLSGQLWNVASPGGGVPEKEQRIQVERPVLNSRKYSRGIETSPRTYVPTFKAFEWRMACIWPRLKTAAYKCHTQSVPIALVTLKHKQQLIWITIHCRRPFRNYLSLYYVQLSAICAAWWSDSRVASFRAILQLPDVPESWSMLMRRWSACYNPIRPIFYDIIHRTVPKHRSGHNIVISGPNRVE